jgi:hypothetical protein
MLLSQKEQPGYSIIMGIDIRKCQFAPSAWITRSEKDATWSIIIEKGLYSKGMIKNFTYRIIVGP